MTEPKYIISTTLDTSGMVCPKPLLYAKKALGKLKSQEILQVICTDPSSVIDFAVFTNKTQNKLLDSWQLDDKYFFLLQKV